MRNPPPPYTGLSFRGVVILTYVALIIGAVAWCVSVVHG